MVHHSDDLIRIFNQCFEQTHQTRLVRGLDEPVYLPRTNYRAYDEIHFAHGFFSSALHECAHWLIAGKERRKQEDYGYWYVPDGRNAEQQCLFQSVEIKPQALEWILSHAARYRFQLSIDNLNGVATEIEVFKQQVYQQALNYQTHGLPARAQIFRDALSGYYASLKISQPTFGDNFSGERIFFD